MSSEGPARMKPMASQRAQLYVKRSLPLLLLLFVYSWFWTNHAPAGQDINGGRPSAPLEHEPTRPPIVISTSGSSTPQVPKTQPDTPQAPPEYTALTDDQQECEEIYGNSYLTDMGATRRQNCEAGSLSALHCFYAKRLWNRWVPWRRDPLCIAQGVSYAPTTPVFSQEYRGAEFELQCRKQNLEPDLVSDYWGDTGAGNTFKTWRFASQQDAGRCSRDNSTGGQWLMLVRREHGDLQNIWHQLMQISQARHTVDALRAAAHPDTGEPWLSADDAARVQVVFDDDRHHALEDLWAMVGTEKPMRTSDLVPGTCYANVIVPLAGSSSPFWSALIGNMKQACYGQTLLDTLARRVLDHYRVRPRSSEDMPADELVVTIVHRAENRKLIGLDRWVASLRRRHPSFRIDVVDFATRSFAEQLRLVQATDVLVGHHGAAMTHTLFMAPESAVVEILPPYFLQRGFRALGRMRGLQYFTGRSMWAEEYYNVTRGDPIPEGWTAPQEHEGWQEREWTYMLDDDFLGLVDAAVRSQLNRLNDDERLGRQGGHGLRPI